MKVGDYLLVCDVGGGSNDVAKAATAIEQAPTGAERRLLRERRDALLGVSDS